MGVLASGERGEVVVVEGVGERTRRGVLEVVMTAGARCSARGSSMSVSRGPLVERRGTATRLRSSPDATRPWLRVLFGVLMDDGFIAEMGGAGQI